MLCSVRVPEMVELSLLVPCNGVAGIFEGWGALSAHDDHDHDHHDLSEQ